jgi:hypothetical protein
MAQTKSASPGQRAGTSRKTSKRSPSKAKARARSASKPKSRSASRPRTRSAGGPKANPASKAKASLAGGPKAAGEAVEETAKDAGRAVGRAAGRAKVPLVAGGAALAGAAGGIALASRHGRHHRFGGLSSEDLAKAARKAGDLGAQVGEIAYEVKRAREATNGNGHHRSPIEVVLQGLTSRSRR